MRRWMQVLLAVAVLLTLVVPAAAQQRRQREGQRRVPFEVLEDPEFVPAAEASFLKDDERVVGVAGPDGLGSVAKAYPVAPLAWHHIVHDQLGGPAGERGAGLPIIPTW